METVINSDCPDSTTTRGNPFAWTKMRELLKLVDTSKTTSSGAELKVDSSWLFGKSPKIRQLLGLTPGFKACCLPVLLHISSFPFLINNEWLIIHYSLSQFYSYCFCLQKFIFHSEKNQFDTFLERKKLFAYLLIFDSMLCILLSPTTGQNHLLSR